MNALLYLKLIFIVFTINFAFVNSLDAQHDLIGKPAPELSIEKFLQAPDVEIDTEQLKGKVVILEFWATWCAPCIAQIPHLNELSEAFEHEPVRFISITDEDESKVKRFLQKRKMNSWIGLDHDRSMFKEYQIRFLPTTILIDTEGRVAAITNPASINRETISNLLTMKTTIKPKSENKTVTSVPSQTKEEPTLFEIIIKPTKEREAVYALNKSAGYFDAYAVSLRTAIGLAYNISPTRIFGPDTLLNKWIQVSVKLPKEHANLFESLFQDALKAAFRFEARREIREIEAFVLSAPFGVTKGLYPSGEGTSHLSTDDGLIVATNWKIDALALNLEDVLNRPVLNETNLKGKYDWDLEFDKDKPESVIAALKEQLGLELKPVRRDLEVLIVSQDQIDQEELSDNKTLILLVKSQNPYEQLTFEGAYRFNKKESLKKLIDKKTPFELRITSNYVEATFRKKTGIADLKVELLSKVEGQPEKFHVSGSGNKIKFSTDSNGRFRVFASGGKSDFSLDWFK